MEMQDLLHPNLKVDLLQDFWLAEVFSRVGYGTRQYFVIFLESFSSCSFPVDLRCSY